MGSGPYRDVGDTGGLWPSRGSLADLWPRSSAPWLSSHISPLQDGGRGRRGCTEQRAPVGAPPDTAGAAAANAVGMGTPILTAREEGRREISLVVRIHLTSTCQV